MVHTYRKGDEPHDTGKRIGEAVTGALNLPPHDRGGSLAPGYREPDGTTYRILNFHSDAEVPANLSKKFRGAIAEWANDSEAATGLTLYTNEEEFRADFARIDIVSDRI